MTGHAPMMAEDTDWAALFLIHNRVETTTKVFAEIKCTGQKRPCAQFSE